MSNFKSQENKELLWSILSQSGTFDNINSTINKQDMVRLFETTVNTISNTNNSNLMEMNKSFIGSMVSSIENYNSEVSNQPRTEQPQLQTRSSGMDERYI